MPLPTAVTTGLDVSPSTVCLLSSDMAESPWATLVWLGGTDGRPTPRFRTIQVYPKASRPLCGRLTCRETEHASRSAALIALRGRKSPPPDMKRREWRRPAACGQGEARAKAAAGNAGGRISAQHNAC